MITFLPEILSALPLTLWVLVLTILFGSLLGLFLAWSQLSGEKSLPSFARGYVGDASGEYNGVVTGQDLSDNRSPEELIAEAVSLAKECDYVIFFGGLNKSAGQDCEDADRAQLGLPTDKITDRSFVKSEQKLDCRKHIG